MDFAVDYNSLSERYYKLKNEFEETTISLKKLNSYENVFPFEGRKQVMPVGRNDSSEKSHSRQDKISSLSESEESASDSDQVPKKVALQSAVITKVDSSKTRKRFITCNSDNKVKTRNRRFLGMVQNTLQKFRDEEIRRQPQDLKRKKAIEKVEAAAEEEKNKIKKQKIELLVKQRNQEFKLGSLEKMMRISQSFELWEKNQKYLLNFIATKTEPQIFFLPTTLSLTATKQHERSRLEIIERIEKQKKFVETILSRMNYINTEETFESSHDDSFENVLKPRITHGKSEDTEEILKLDISENESEDF